MSRKFLYGAKRFQDQVVIQKFLQSSLAGMQAQLEVISISLEFKLATRIDQKPASIVLFWSRIDEKGLTVSDQLNLYERLVEMISGFKNLFIFQANDQGEDPKTWVVELRIDNYNQFTTYHHDDDDQDYFFPTVIK